MMRRDVIRAVGGALTAGVAGCTGYEDDDDQQTAQQYERRCTSAEVTAFDIDTNWMAEDEFEFTIINQSDMAGEVVVELIFRDKDTENVVSTMDVGVSIGAQARVTESVFRNWPRENLEAFAHVDRQDCRRVRVGGRA